MSENKTRPTAASVDAFLTRIEAPKKRAEAEELRDLMSEVTGEDPVLWGHGIIGFGSYHYKYESGREGDMPITGFSPRKTSFSIYIMSGFSEYDALLARLGKHKTGKSCLYVNKLDDIDRDVLKELVTASVRHMRTKYGA